MPNFLEQLCAEWFEYNGYFVRRNVNVGRREKGGFECELDIVAFHPMEPILGRPRLVHYEPTTDAQPWDKRRERYEKKFNAGRKHIPSLFSSFGRELPPIEQYVLLGFGSAKNNPTLAGGTVVTIKQFLADVRKELKSPHHAAVPEQFALLRTLQYAAFYWH